MLSESSAQLFLDLGIIYFILLMYWLVSLWKEILASCTRGGMEMGWVVFSLWAGLFYSLSSGMEWGWTFAGTAFSLGLCLSLALIHPSAAASLLASSLFLRPWELFPNDPYLSLLPRLSFVLCLAHLVLRYAKYRKVEAIWSSMTLCLIAFSLGVSSRVFFLRILPPLKESTSMGSVNASFSI
jgi:hypothetical protein